jgi:hypothetical protein
LYTFAYKRAPTSRDNPEKKGLPQRQYARGKPVRLLEIDDIVDGGDVLPGFTLAARDIYYTDESEEES